MLEHSDKLIKKLEIESDQAILWCQRYVVECYLKPSERDEHNTTIFTRSSFCKA